VGPDPVLRRIKIPRNNNLKEESLLVVPMSDLAAEYRSLKTEIDEAVGRVLASGDYVLGDELEAFEEAFADYVGARYAIGVGSGTASLHLALAALNLGPEDEVITVPNTDNPTASAVTHAGAKVVLAETTGDTFTMDPDKLEEKITPRTKVILPVHLFGHPADMDPICEIADRNGITVLEDSALAVGGEYKGRRTGTFGPLGCFSTAPGKILGGYGDGGMVVTDDPHLADRIRVLRNYGHAPGLRLSGSDLTGGTGWKVLEEGFNQRLDTIQAAILAAKLPTLEDRIAGRRRAAALYRTLFADSPVTAVHEAPWARHVYFAYNAMVPEGVRDQARDYLASRGVASRLYYNPPLHLHPAYGWMGLGPGSLPVAEKTASRMIGLPCFPQITESQVEEAAATLLDFLGAG
ncbi:MAG: DegT/DnrJ/EryC1/StrS family aminotransferase, partial [Acidimicrobiia bacterium]|nr:DegT/DnrJ/EryC1/StrS family aminotransferase [Acidimicrobiia bacterium]